MNGRFHMTMNGHVQDQSVADEQSLAFKFKDDLLRSPLISRHFLIQMSLEKSGDTSGLSKTGLDPDALRAQLENRTAFTLDLQSKSLK
jgi:hypothetical protein